MLEKDIRRVAICPIIIGNQTDNMESILLENEVREMPSIQELLVT